MDCVVCGNSPVVKMIEGKPHCEDCAYEHDMPRILKDLGVMPIFHKARLSQCPGLPFDKSLFLTGPAGTGKTHIAVALLVDHIKDTPFAEKADCAFTTMIDLLDELKAAFSRPVNEQLWLIHNYCNVEFLVIDDIGVELPTEWAVSHIYRIVNHRWGCDKQTIFTSNFNYKQLSEKLDTRIVSRIMGMCEVVELSGSDLRKRR